MVLEQGVGSRGAEEQFLPLVPLSFPLFPFPNFCKKSIRPLAKVFFCFSPRHEVASRTPNSLPKARVDAFAQRCRRLDAIVRTQKVPRRSPYAKILIIWWAMPTLLLQEVYCSSKRDIFTSTLEDDYKVRCLAMLYIFMLCIIYFALIGNIYWK